MNPKVKETFAHLKLAIPLVGVQAGIQLMAVVDTIMVGRLSPQALAGVGLGNSLFFAFTLIGLGCVAGIDPLISQAIGAKEKKNAESILFNGLFVALVVGIPIFLILYISPFLLSYIGINTALVIEVSDYLNGRSINIFMFLLYGAFRSFNQSTGDTKPIIISIIVANIINLGANTILIYGVDGIGLEPMGVFGAGMASSIASIFSLIILARANNLSKLLSNHLDYDLIKKIFIIGLPVGFHYFSEMGSFMVINVFVGLMGTIETAAYEVAMTLASFTFTIALGASAAASVRVGISIGQNDSRGAHRAGMTALTISSLITCVLAILFFIYPEMLAWILTNNESVVKASIPLIQIASVFALVDNLQVVASGGLRGIGDTKKPFFIQAISHYTIGIPIAAYLGFYLGFGAPGLWWGLTIGLTIAGIILSYRLWFKTNQVLVRI